MNHISKDLQLGIKRTLDVVASILLLVFFAPAFFLVSASVLLLLGWPIFFVQIRPGLNEHPFKILKFRTMSNARDSGGELLPDNLRLGRFGRFIRSTSLDEIPQLINVLSGNMSLVGPRPLLMEYLSLYSPRQALRHKVRPGVTGYAQISGRNELSWEKRLELDVWYVENWSLWLDLKILISTCRIVIGRKGVNQERHATVDKFRGTQI